MYKLKIVTRNGTKEVCEPIEVSYGEWIFNQKVISLMDAEGKLHYIGYCSSLESAENAIKKIREATYDEKDVVELEEIQEGDCGEE